MLPPPPKQPQSIASPRAQAEAMPTSKASMSSRVSPAEARVSKPPMSRTPRISSNIGRPFPTIGTRLSGSSWYARVARTLAGRSISFAYPEYSSTQPSTTRTTVVTTGWAGTNPAARDARAERRSALIVISSGMASAYVARRAGRDTMRRRSRRRTGPGAAPISASHRARSVNRRSPGARPPPELVSPQHENRGDRREGHTQQEEDESSRASRRERAERPAGAEAGPSARRAEPRREHAGGQRERDQHRVDPRLVRPTRRRA